MQIDSTRDWLNQIDLGQKSVLVVANDLDLETKVAKPLRPRSIQWLQVFSCQKALEILSLHTPDGIFINGKYRETEREFLKALQLRASESSIPFQFFSKRSLVFDFEELLFQLEKEPRRPAPLETENSELSLGQGKTSLIVGENLEELLLLAEQMESWGYQILLARNGFQALVQLEENPKVDLVLMDMQLSKMSGREVFQRIRKHSKFSHLPVVLIGESSENEQEEERVLFLCKPIHRETLSAILQSFADPRKPDSHSRGTHVAR